MSNRQKKAILIGCGLTGPALALFLKHAHFDVEIYEARTQPEGYGLSLASNGLKVLEELGLAEAAFQFGSPITGSVMWSGQGKHLADMPMAGEGKCSLLVKRIPLGDLLENEARRVGIQITHGKKLEQIHETTEGVVALFQDGTTASGNLLIGSDGVHSRTRHLIDPTYPGATYTGLMNLGGFTQGVYFEPTPKTFHFIFGKHAFFGYHVYETGEAVWFVNFTQAEEPARGSMLQEVTAERKQKLVELFPNEMPIIHQMINSTQEMFPDFPTYIIKQKPRWHTSKVSLIGDAAHAVSSSSGQGASMAMEDALMMAKCLRDIPQIEEAFATFERLRAKRVAKILDLGLKGDSGKFSKGDFQVWMRDAMTSFFLTFFANEKGMRWVYDYPLEWGTPIETAK